MRIARLTKAIKVYFNIRNILKFELRTTDRAFSRVVVRWTEGDFKGTFCTLEDVHHSHSLIYSSNGIGSLLCMYSKTRRNDAFAQYLLPQ